MTFSLFTVFSTPRIRLLTFAQVFLLFDCIIYALIRLFYLPSMFIHLKINIIMSQELFKHNVKINLFTRKCVEPLQNMKILCRHLYSLIMTL